MWCKYPRLGVAAAQGLGSAGGISLLNGGLHMYLWIPVVLLQVKNQLISIFSTSREELYSKTLAGSVTTPPLLIVFYKQHSSIDPMWNVRHLGTYEAFVVLLPQGVFPGQ